MVNFIPKKSIVIWICLLSLFLSCEDKIESGQISIVPYPSDVEIKSSNQFLMNDQVIISYSEHRLKSTSEYLSGQLKKYYGLNIVNEFSEKNMKNSIHLSINIENDDLKEEGYSLEVNKQRITIEAIDEEGAFYGVQTLLQLLPSNRDSILFVPGIEILDKPTFSWRGMQLDVASHFFDKEFVKRYIDILAMHKMNVLHLHLFDDYGWRLQLDSFPELAEVGAWRKKHGVANQQGGFYSKNDIQELIEYANEQHVMIVPEINAPGRGNAVLSALPQLGCVNKEYSVAVPGEYFHSYPLCVGKDETMIFYKKLIAEIAELFTAPYIIVGGNVISEKDWEDCSSCRKKMDEQSILTYAELKEGFNQDIENIIIKNGKQVIGTYEFIDSKLNSEAIILNWNQKKDKKTKLFENYDVVHNDKNFEFNHYQAFPEFEPDAIMPQVLLFDVYRARVEKSDGKGKSVIGMHGTLWTQKIVSEKLAQQMLLPRLCALSEIAWTYPEKHQWERFMVMLNRHYTQLDKIGAEYYIPLPEGCADDILFEGEVKKIWLSTPIEDALIRYTLDDTEPTLESSVYTSPITVSGTAVLKAKTFLPSGKSSNTKVARYAEEPIKEGMKNLVNLYPGIQYSYFEGTFNSVKDLTDANAMRKGNLKVLLKPEEISEDHYALEYEGLIYIKKEGVYTFYLTSDDGSDLTIDGYSLIDNDGIHNVNTKMGRIGLRGGYHAINVRYFDVVGHDTLVLEFDGPGIQKQPLPHDFLFFSKE